MSWGPAMPTTMDLALSKASLADDLLAVSEILLRLPSPADLIRAALASKSWLEAASSNKFHQDYRERHPSPLLGLYVSREFADGLPSFHVADSVRSDPALSRFARRGDFNLVGLESHPKWSLLDCNGGRLLLTDGESLVMYEPSSGRRVSNIPLCEAEAWNDSIAECLLRGDSDDLPSSFRVVCVQHRRRGRAMRAVEYNSRTGRWREHQWEDKIMRPQHNQAMRAGRFIFWRYKESLLLVLDTETMGFSTVALPRAFFQPHMYAIGETEHGGCCLVGLVGTSVWGLKLQVWLLQENGAARSKEADLIVPVTEVLSARARVSQVHLVSNGLAFLCMKSNRCRQFAVDLKKMCLKAEFECGTLGYPINMPWPPTLLVGTDSDAANDVVDVEAQHILAIEDLKMGAYQVDASVSEICTIVEEREAEKSNGNNNNGGHNNATVFVANHADLHQQQGNQNGHNADLADQGQDSNNSCVYQASLEQEVFIAGTGIEREQEVEVPQVPLDLPADHIIDPQLAAADAVSDEPQIKEQTVLAHPVQHVSPNHQVRMEENVSFSFSAIEKSQSDLDKEAIVEAIMSKLKNTLMQLDFIRPAAGKDPVVISIPAAETKIGGTENKKNMLQLLNEKHASEAQIAPVHKPIRKVYIRKRFKAQRKYPDTSMKEVNNNIRLIASDTPNEADNSIEHVEVVMEGTESNSSKKPESLILGSSYLQTQQPNKMMGAYPVDASASPPSPPTPPNTTPPAVTRQHRLRKMGKKKVRVFPVGVSLPISTRKSSRLAAKNNEKVESMTAKASNLKALKDNLDVMGAYPVDASAPPPTPPNTAPPPVETTQQHRLRKMGKKKVRVFLARVSSPISTRNSSRLAAKKNGKIE